MSLWRRLKMRRDHRWAQPHLSAYVEGELTGDPQERLRRHEGICPECRAAIRQLRALLRRLPELRRAAPPSVAEAAAQAVRREIDRGAGSG